MEPGFEWQNRAQIYFDGNPAVLTNTVTNRIPTVVTSTASAQNRERTLRVFPNPSDGVFRIQFSGDKAVFTLTDIQGRKIDTGHVENQGTLNLRNLKPGIYVLKVDGYKPERLIVQP